MTSKYKICCTNDAFYPEICFCLKRAGIPFAQKDETRPVVCRAEKDEFIREAFSKCLLKEEDYSILKKVGESWVAIPHEVQEVKENDALTGLSDKAKKIYNDLQNGVKLSSSDLSYLVYNFELDDQREVGENRRWQRGVTSIIELGGKHYAISWEEGLTENQENDFWEQPVEVEKHEYEKVVTITEWKPVGKEREEEIEK